MLGFVLGSFVVRLSEPIEAWAELRFPLSENTCRAHHHHHDHHHRVSTWDAVIIVILASSIVIHVIIALFIIVLVVIFLVVTIAFVDMAIVSVVEVIPICCHSIDCDSNYTIVLIIATIEALVSS